VLSLVFVLLSDYSQPEISEDRMLGYIFIIIFLLQFVVTVAFFYVPFSNA
jgi:hypothetical protein